MKTLFSSAIALSLLLGFTAPVTAAPGSMTQATCKKWIKWGDRFGNSPRLKKGTALDSFCNTDCKPGAGVAICRPTLDALKGKPDPKLQAAVGDLFFFWGNKKDDKRKRMCVKTSCRVSNWQLAPVVYQLPNAKELLTKFFKSKETMDMICSEKGPMARALWYLADKSTLDVLIDSYGNTLCNPGHAKNTLPLIHLLGPNDAQKKKLEGYCEKVFAGPYQGDLRNAKDVIPACYRYLANVGTKNDDLLEYVRQGSANGVEALRALAILDAKGSKKTFKKRLAKEKKRKKIYVKGGKKKEMDTWRGHMEAVVSALGLGYKNKDAKKAINWWLSYNVSWKNLNDPSGFESLVLTAPFFPKDKNLLKAIEKGYKTVLKAADEKDNLTVYALRAAIGLAQMGSKKGLPTIIDALKGTDKGHQEEALRGIGGITYHWGTFRWGTGGLKVGGKDGLKKGDVEKLITTILKKFKFMGKNQHAATLAVLDLRARLKAAGL
jgi:hypothetical protein